VSEEWVRGVLKRVEKRAGLAAALGKCHKLRHTFCSRLAMANVPMLAIQKLAGHESIETTQRYMHLSTAARPTASVPSTSAAVEAPWRRQGPLHKRRGTTCS
jgi:site-specific recombinase XerD